MFRPAAVVALACLLMSGCHRIADSLDSAGHPGRYAGIGLYQPSKQWAKLAAAEAAGDERTARRADDQVIIVVQDSRTGEVRACGDLTGYCIGMNPWKAALTADRITPVKLTEHVADAPDQRASKPSKSEPVGG
jgi:hypothetical protein